MITYKTHTETVESKKHTDILLNNKYVGYFINESKTVFIEHNGEMFAEEFRTIKQLKEAINYFIKTLA